MTLNRGLNKELISSFELTSPYLEASSHRPREVVIYDQTSHQLEEVRRAILEMKPVEIIESVNQPTTPKIVKKGDSPNRWKNVFNYRKERMVN